MSKRSKRPPSQRQLRVGEELRHILARIFERDEMRDPDLVGVSITVSEVRIGPDLRNATVFVTRLGGGKSEEIVTALQRVAPYLRHQIAQRVHLRHVPDLTFEADTSFDHAEHIGQLLRDATALDGVSAAPEED